MDCPECGSLCKLVECYTLFISPYGDCDFEKWGCTACETTWVTHEGALIDVRCTKCGQKMDSFRKHPEAEPKYFCTCDQVRKAGARPSVKHKDKKRESKKNPPIPRDMGDMP